MSCDPFAASTNTAMTLADFTSPGLIIPHLVGRDIASVIQELSQVLRREQRIQDLLPFYQNALNREFMSSTDMEAGMAFPHARLPGLKEVCFAMGSSDTPMAWGPRATHSVWIVVLMAVPATDSTQYLLLLSGLTRLTKAALLVEELRAAQCNLEMFHVLQQVVLRTNPASDAVKKALA
jgi:mannitol/fructose-specific phosphotransferase system IIA component (Ntr-type)